MKKIVTNTKNAQKALSNILTKQENYIIYALGNCFKSFDSSYKDKPLTVSVSKAAFIELLQNSHAMKRNARTLYRTLEHLEEKKYIIYDNKDLRFSKKGFKIFSEIDNEIETCFAIVAHLNNPKTVAIHRQLQTKFRNY